MSHALIRCIKPQGHLYTFDFHEYRVSVAREEFETHGIGQYVSVKQQDVCQDGFGTELNGKADALFLDLPHPWEAVPHAAAVIKDLGKLNQTYRFEGQSNDFLTVEGLPNELSVKMIWRDVYTNSLFTNF